MVYRLRSAVMYKGFLLQNWLYSYDNFRWHRECQIYFDDLRVGIAPSLVAAKDSIDSGYFDKYRDDPRLLAEIKLSIYED